MADTKITGLTENTTPALQSILPIVGDPSGSPVTQKITVANLRGGYVLQAGCAASNPADATTYYIGSLHGAAMLTGSAQLTKLYVPRAGTVTKVYGFFFNTVTGTSISSTIYLRLNDTTDTTISSAVNNSTAVQTISASPSFDVAVGDYFEFKWVTPTWASNPTGVYFSGVIYIS